MVRVDCPAQVSHCEVELYGNFAADRPFNLIQSPRVDRYRQEHPPQRFACPREPFAAEGEYVRVICGDEEDFVMTLQPRASLLAPSPSPPAEEAGRPPNVLMLLLDGISRLHFLRSMPRTVALLEGWRAAGAAAPLQPFQFLRYHSQGVQSLFNLRWIFCGLWDVTPERLWWGYYARKHHFATAFLHGMCDDVIQQQRAPGLNFTAAYGGGAEDAMADHELALPYCHHDYSAERSNFQGPYSMGRRCIAGRPVHDHTFTYLSEFISAYPKRGFAASALLYEAHEGSLSVARVLDAPLAAFLAALPSRRPDTVVALVSDHGLHMGPYFQFSDAGRAENKLPLLVLLLPHRVAPKGSARHAALQVNEQRLASHVDLWRTLTALSGGVPEYWVNETYPGRPLWEELPAGRPCGPAQIPGWHCVCAGAAKAHEAADRELTQQLARNGEAMRELLRRHNGTNSSSSRNESAGQ